ncbi:MAG: DUF488 domain-containing protein [Bacteroidales bacterium]|nr:DUF488 domain-containing protein [Bacteroidales bacterium]MCF8336738.1 DUF488 domain-containing protein [Bacteroidales bacterium]
MESTIYSIGHGNKKIEDFIDELKNYEISYVLDVRTKPYSKWNPQFNQPALKSKLKEETIQYVYAGDKLGGLPDDSSCYDNNGKVMYNIIKQKDFFKQGLKRITTANNKRIRLAIMCSESKPEQCHRSKLIGQELLKNKISVKHIISSGNTKSQETVINELTKGKGVVDLFGNEKDFTSRKAY